MPDLNQWLKIVEILYYITMILLITYRVVKPVAKRLKPVVWAWMRYSFKPAARRLSQVVWAWMRGLKLAATRLSQVVWAWIRDLEKKWKQKKSEKNTPQRLEKPMEVKTRRGDLPRME